MLFFFNLPLSRHQLRWLHFARSYLNYKSQLTRIWRFDNGEINTLWTIESARRKAKKSDTTCNISSISEWLFDCDKLKCHGPQQRYTCDICAFRLNHVVELMALSNRTFFFSHIRRNASRSARSYTTNVISFSRCARTTETRSTEKSMQTFLHASEGGKKPQNRGI